MKKLQILTLSLLLFVTVSYGENSQGRIWFGTLAEQGEFPGMLALKKFDSVYLQCGASILDANWALTAAHCVDGFQAEELTLYAGSVDLETGGTLHTGAEVIMHEDYTGYPDNSSKYDIAVIRVATPFNIDGTNVAPVTLPTGSSDDPADDSPIVAIGWGYDEQWNLTKDLKKVDLQIVNQDTCNTFYTTENRTMPVVDTQICAENAQDGTKGTCMGDSGGPFLSNNVVVGIMMWKFSWCPEKPGFPTVATRVSSFRDWITEKTGV